MNGSRFHPPQRSRSVIPASCAMRSSSDGPHVPERHRERARPARRRFEVVGDEALRRHVVLVDAPVALAGVEHAEGVAGWEPPQFRHHDLDHETAAGLEVRGGVPEAGHLCVLRREIPDRVEDEVDERERHRPRPWRSRRSYADRVAAGFARSRSTIAVDRSIPWTGTPRPASGSAMRPVPIPSSSARPPPRARRGSPPSGR